MSRVLTLRFLGSTFVEVDGAAVSGAVAHRHPLALLALLVRAPSGQLSRDKLVGYLWPDSSPRRARHRLRDTIYTVRRTLGAEAVLSVGDDLRLDAEGLDIDVLRFEAALAQGALVDAVALYTGPFLDGFYLNHSRSFEHWLESERTDLARAYGSALRRLAESAENEGLPRQAASWWQRLAREVPYDSDVALSLMRSLAAAGDRAGAVRYAERHAARLAEDLEVAPDDRIQALVRTLTSASPHEPWKRMPSRLSDPIPEVGLDTTPRGRRAPRIQEGQRARDRTFRLPWNLSWPVLGALAVAVAIGLAMALARTEEGVAVATRVAVFPFEVRGEGRYSYLEEGLVDLLSVKLALPDETQTVDPTVVLRRTDERRSPAEIGSLARMAKSLGAGSFVHGSVVQSDGEAHIIATLYSTETSRSRVTADVSLSEEATLFDAVDRLSRALLGGWLTPEADELVKLAGLTTTSLPAFKSYLSGERSLRRGRYAESVTRFVQATELDPDFALAHYRLSVAANWANSPDLVRSSAQTAWRLRAELPERVRRLLEVRNSYYAEREGASKSMRLLKAIVADYPDAVEARYELADLRFHNGWLWGLDDAAVRRDLEHVLVYDPVHPGALSHLARLAARQRDLETLDTLVERGLSVLDDGRSRDEMLALAAFSRRDARAQGRVLERFRDLDVASLYPIAAITVTFTENYADALRLIALLTRSHHAASTRSYGLAWSAVLEAARGRLDTARTMLRSDDQHSPSGTFVALLVELTNPIGGNRVTLETALERAAALDTRSMGKLATQDPFQERFTRETTSLLLGLAAARLGDTTKARRYAAELERSPAVNPWPEASAFLPGAALALWSENPQEALHLLRDGWKELPSFPAGWQVFLRAEALRAAGNYEEALRWYSALPPDYDFAPLFAAVSHLRSAEVCHRLQRHAEGDRHLRRVTELWGDSDPAFQMLLQATRDSIRAIQ